MNDLAQLKLDALRDLDQSLPMALLKAREAAMEQFRPLLRQHQLTEQQWRVIRILHAVGPLEVGDLARRCLLLAPSLSRILQNLQGSGLVERSGVRSDGRRFSISLTTGGEQLFGSIAPESEAIYRQIEARFGRARLGQLLALLQELDATLSSSRHTGAP